MRYHYLKLTLVNYLKPVSKFFTIFIGAKYLKKETQIKEKI
jgi:hypothetical protein